MEMGTRRRPLEVLPLPPGINNLFACEVMYMYCIALRSNRGGGGFALSVFSRHRWLVMVLVYLGTKAKSAHEMGQYHCPCP